MQSLIKHTIAAVIATAAITASAQVATQAINLGSGMQYKLEPNDPQVLANEYLWNVYAKCTVISSHYSDGLLSIKMLRKEGKLNDETLSKDESRTIYVNKGDKFKITAPSGAKVELLNIGTKTIKSECEFWF